MTIEYDGTNYSGWQIQKNSVSIQESIEKAIITVTGQSINLTGSSRTDAGVHAKGMTANFFCDTTIPEKSIAAAINSKLPEDIAILDAQYVDENFHSRYSSTGKRYSYTILNRRVSSPLLRNFAAHVWYPLCIDSMREACKYFLGTQDFSAFMSTGSSVKTTIRTIRLLNLVHSDDIIKLYIEADGFLYNMVRIISGTLIDIGRGIISPNDITRIIESKDRERAGKTAPPQGLCLEEVYY
ncbi:tRNA pseudouridine synthase A [Oxobacter pfennigii]|uniref:tRNA pseudouridine synthase A n=1 Tax=Oxobacter pfennigii TaxID=36849 RepID=A0A0P8WWD8_9CLOT|nr:tRNA pseudouridine synthase A [Oxobacter pfennigii]